MAPLSALFPAPMATRSPEANELTNRLKVPYLRRALADLIPTAKAPHWDPAEIASCWPKRPPAATGPTSTPAASGPGSLPARRSATGTRLGAVADRGAGRGRLPGGGGRRQRAAGSGHGRVGVGGQWCGTAAGAARRRVVLPPARGAGRAHLAGAPAVPRNLRPMLGWS